MDATYPLSPQGVFHTIQGEGVLLGQPSVFIRLAGCPVGCPQCDTDYSVHSRATAQGIARQAAELATPNTRWAWITGGEPLIHSWRPLVGHLHRAGFQVAIATSGIRSLSRDSEGPEFLSVSPHSMTHDWVQRSGEQVNLAFGLNGLLASDCERSIRDFDRFDAKFVTPCEGDAESLATCLAWVNRHPGWRLGVQAHKLWGMA